MPTVNVLDFMDIGTEHQIAIVAVLFCSSFPFLLHNESMTPF